MKKKILVAVFAILVFNIAAAVAGSNSADEEFLQYIQQCVLFYEKSRVAERIYIPTYRACTNGRSLDSDDPTYIRCTNEATAAEAAATGDTQMGHHDRCKRLSEKADNIFRNNKLKKQTLSKAK